MRHAPAAARLLLLQRGVALFAAAFAPPLSLRSSVGKNYDLTLFHSRSNKQQKEQPPSVLMATLCTSPAATKMGSYARQLRGEWSLQPAVALNQLVPTLAASKHKGQVRTIMRRAGTTRISVSIFEVLFYLFVDYDQV